jgi:hypothetical protein
MRSMQDGFSTLQINGVLHIVGDRFRTGAYTEREKRSSLYAACY